MQIIIIQGHAVIFDDALPFGVDARKFSVSRNRNTHYVRIGRKYLHRVVMDAQPNQIIDHINGNGLDNRVKNLRLSSYQANRANCHTENSTSKFIGVSVASDRQRKKPFRVQAKLNGTKIHLGYFESEIDAAKAYDAYAIQTYGKSAALNFANRVPPPLIQKLV